MTRQDYGEIEKLKMIAFALGVKGRTGLKPFHPGVQLTRLEDGRCLVRINCLNNPEFWLELTIDSADALDKYEKQQQQ